MTSTSSIGIVGPPATLLALLVGLVLVLVAPAWVAAPVGIAVGFAMYVFVRRSALSVAQREFRAAPITDDRRAQIDNIVEGLCLSSGLMPPRIHVVESVAPDAAVIGRNAHDADMVVTTGALEDLSRLELEALMARTLCLLNGAVEPPTLLCAAGRLLGRGALAGRYIRHHLDPESVLLADFAGVRLTRYPPALASVMGRARDAGGVAPNPTTDHLWLFGPVDLDDPRRPPLEQRIDTLQEL